MGPNETNPVLRALDDITTAMLEVGMAYRGELMRQKMPGGIADAAVIQSAVAALVTLEIVRLKIQVPSVDVEKLADEVEEIRKKTRVALQEAVLQAAQKNNPNIRGVRDSAMGDYLGEEFSWPAKKGRERSGGA